MPDYIPSTDSGFNDWLTNFSTLITADPTAYGLTAGNALDIAAEQTAYNAAYVAATDPGTRTTPTIAAKDSAKADALAVVRPYAIQINNNAAVTNMQRADLGITVRKVTKTPVPAPTSTPALELISATPLIHSLRYSDVEFPTGKAKPAGSIGVQIYASIGATPSTDPAEASYVGTYTKSPLMIPQLNENVGLMANYFARYCTRSGPAGVAQVGPWSSLLSATII